MKRILLVLLLILVAGQTSLYAEREVIDKIVAVVGNEVVLASELASQIQMIALEMKVQPKSEAEVKQLQQDILDQMISDRLFLIAARGDSMIQVRDDELEQMLDDQVARIAQNFNTYDEFLEALKAENLSIRELKKQNRKDVENQLLKQKFIQRELYSVSVSKHEVEEFYEMYKDSIPSQPEAVKLSHILISFKPSPQVEDSIKNFAESLRQQILDGSDFAVLSTQHSTAGAGANGGDLGYISKEDVVPEFARAAFNLQVGDVSGVVRTQFGYHIIKCEGTKDDLLKLRHILLSVVPSSEDSTAVRVLADSLLNEAWNKADFEHLAKSFSDDNETRPQGGELGWFAISSLPQEFIDAVSGWQDIGDVRGPVETEYGLHIIKLLDHEAAKQLALESDFDQIKEMARQKKTALKVDDWVEEIKKKTYIKYNIEF